MKIVTPCFNRPIAFSAGAYSGTVNKEIARTFNHEKSLMFKYGRMQRKIHPG